jgi:methyl coenzyme M reductase subunit C
VPEQFTCRCIEPVQRKQLVKHRYSQLAHLGRVRHFVVVQTRLVLHTKGTNIRDKRRVLLHEMLKKDAFA